MTVNLPALPAIKAKGKHHVTSVFNTTENRRVLRKGKLPIMKARRVLDELSARFGSEYNLTVLKTDGKTVFAVVVQNYLEEVFRMDGEGNTFSSIEYREKRIPLLV